MRCFVAIDIDQETRTALADLQRRLVKGADIKKSDVKWVNPKNVHLTLNFLGEIKDEKVIEVCNIVKDVTGRHESFELDVKSVGHFGGKSARVLWVGAGEGNSNLLHLQKDIADQLALAGWTEQTRQFTGHLTLCRIRNPRAGAELVKASQQYKNFKLGIILADSVSVYQSQLTPTGPNYTLLGNYKLK